MGNSYRALVWWAVLLDLVCVHRIPAAAQTCGSGFWHVADPIGGPAATCYDSTREQILVLIPTGNGTCETWISHGQSLTHVDVASPTDRGQCALACDPERQRIVLFGGINGAPTGDTWEWDGSRWQQLAVTGPSPRSGLAMAFDPSLHKVVLFGGDSAVGLLNDTWTFDGLVWSQVATGGPSARAGHSMAIDPIDGRIMLFGGHSLDGSTSVPNNDTWKWDGESWYQVNATSPVGGDGFSLAYNIAREAPTLIAPSSLGGIYELRNSHWTWRDLHTNPPSAAGIGGYDDAIGRMYMLCSLSDGQIVRLATWDNVRYAWDLTSAPCARFGHTMAYDSWRRQVVLINGYVYGISTDPQTWLLDGDGWRAAAAPAPAVNLYAAMAFDSWRGRTVAFGHTPGSQTWEWDGSDWALVSQSGPLGRSEHAMAFDSWRGRTVLFGGQDSTGNPTDTWEWDGQSWQRVATTGPSARVRCSMAFDSVRGKCVLFGGPADTWEWDGSVWVQVAREGPPKRYYPGLAFDPVRARTLMFGGALLQGSQQKNDLWQWDGVSWSEIDQGQQLPPVRGRAAAAYDTHRDLFVVFGGDTEDERTWVWAMNDPPAIVDQPQAVNADLGAAAIFDCRAASQSPLAFSWRKNGVPLSNGDGVSGADSPTLTISPVTSGSYGTYDVEITNDCGATVSLAAELTPICGADFDHSGFVDTDDFDAFVGAFEAGSDNADFDQSGFVDTDDFDAFVHAFELGC